MRVDYITSRAALKAKLEKEEYAEFKLLLNGGVFSRKGIRAAGDGKYYVHNFIDDTDDAFNSLDEMCDQTLIGEAIEKNAFCFDA